MMSRAEEKEIIKALAYGYTAVQIAAECGISINEAIEFAEIHAEEIDIKRSERYE
ncbi:MAG: hypothetical protein IJ368_09450 [Oscillospiraceae bacterium]|nr:hypothetical protein [Oscillospiraceae bacterium]